MFTGLVEVTVEVLEHDTRTGKLTVNLPLRIAGDIRIGDSVSIDGACLTVVSAGDGKLEFDLSPETLATIAEFRIGALANLELAMQASGRLGGHFVTGHVDGIATVAEVRGKGGNRRMRVVCPAKLLKHIVPKGSVALAGVSLTVCEKLGDGFNVQLVPHTLASTNLSRAGKGSTLNIETDLVAKHIEALLAARK